MAFALWIEAKTKTPASAATTSTRGVFMSISFPRDFVSYKHGSKGKDSLTATRRKTTRERGGLCLLSYFFEELEPPRSLPHKYFAKGSNSTPKAIPSMPCQVSLLSATIPCSIQ